MTKGVSQRYIRVVYAQSIPGGYYCLHDGRNCCLNQVWIRIATAKGVVFEVTCQGRGRLAPAIDWVEILTVKDTQNGIILPVVRRITSED